MDAEPDDEPEGPRPIRKRFDARRRDDDGTASATTWAPPTRAHAQGTQRVWRPPLDEAPKKSGGIRFDDDDDDLADYMHSDDVPKKPDP
jgi:hypothetical protein